MNDLQSAIRNAEGTLSVARDNLKLYEDKFKQWRDEVRIAKAVLDRLREAAGVPLDAPVLRPLPGPTIAETVAAEKKEVAAVPAAGHFPAPLGANGFDRMAARRKFREWCVSYPLRESYIKSPSQIARQALKSILSDHPNYKGWLADGHVNLKKGKGVGMGVLRHAAKAMGVDSGAIEVEVEDLFFKVIKYGTEGMDYLGELK